MVGATHSYILYRDIDCLAFMDAIFPIGTGSTGYPIDMLFHSHGYDRFGYRQVYYIHQLDVEEIC